MSADLGSSVSVGTGHRSVCEGIGNGTEDMAPKQQGEIVLVIVEGFTIDRHNDVDITLTAPADDSSPAEVPSRRSRAGFSPLASFMHDPHRMSIGRLLCRPSFALTSEPVCCLQADDSASWQRQPNPQGQVVAHLVLESRHEVPPLAGCQIPDTTAEDCLAEQVAELEDPIVRPLRILPHGCVIGVGRQAGVVTEQTDLVEGLRQPRVGPEDILPVRMHVQEGEVDVGPFHLAVERLDAILDSVPVAAGSS